MTPPPGEPENIFFPANPSTPHPKFQYLSTLPETLSGLHIINPINIWTFDTGMLSKLNNYQYH